MVLRKGSIAEQKGLDDQFALLVSNVVDYAIFMLDPTGVVVTWNEGAQRVKGYSADEIIGRHFSVFYPAEEVRNRKPDWELEIAVRVVLPGVFPYMLDGIRLNLKAVMLLLIAGESLAATVGLGYRVFVVRRYLAMDIIIPYVLWMTALLFAVDWLLRTAVDRPRRFQWVKNPI